MTANCRKCNWHAIAPDRETATRKLAEHIVDEHSREVPIEPGSDEGAYVSYDGGDTWERVTDPNDLHNHESG